MLFPVKRNAQDSPSASGPGKTSTVARGRLGWSSLAIGSVVVLAACAAQTPVPAAPPMTSIAATPYQINPADSLEIRFYKSPELNIQVPVRSDGKISVEPVGDVQAAGLTPEELSEVLRRLYERELYNPRVTVIVRSFGGRIFVGGEVKSPSVQPYADGMTALQAINAAGGFLDTAHIDNVVLIRREGDTRRGYRLELNKAISGEDPSADPLLQPFDIVEVPKTSIANMDRFVDQYVRKMLPVNPGLAIPAF